MDGVKVPKSGKIRKNADGDWVYYNHGSHGTIVPERICHHDGQRFVTYLGRPNQNHCSRKCGWECQLPECRRVNLSRKPPVAITKPLPPDQLPFDYIRLPPGNRVRRDEDGVWWWHWPATNPKYQYERRTIVHVQVCHRCNLHHIMSPSRRNQLHCGRVCSSRCELPGCAEINVARQGPRADKSPHWTGGRKVDGKGRWLVYAPYHPCNIGSTDRYVFEHRLVMERMIGRFLTSAETVHHIDGNPSNNDPANLQLRSSNHGPGAQFECADCGSHNIKAVPI